MGNQTSRRQFVRASAGAAAAILTARKASSFASPEVRMAVRLDSEIGVIRPELHGQFAEHLGSCVYGGLWVGKNSKIPNISGYRKEAVEYLGKLGIPVLRWPGGCFADDYHWRDGIGPAEKRPKSVNMHWGNYVEDNSFGTHEFMGLCKLIGAEPYLAGNVGSGTPEELRHWVEYCNYPSGSSLADERAANGSPEPFRVKYWGVGNENWGCGGNMTGEEYATQYRRYATFMRPFGETRPFLIGCGPNKNDAKWTEGFLQTWHNKGALHGFSMHFYSNGRATATKFGVEQMKEQFATFPQLEKAVGDQRALMDKYDPQRKIGLICDEWGVWDRMDPEEEKKYGRLWQQITMRSAVASGLGLNVFHRNSEKLIMANIAQMVNVLHALLLTEEDKCVRTPTYYVYELMKPHRGQTSLKMETPEAISASASRKGNEFTLTLVNQNHEEGMSVRASMISGSVKSAKGRLLHDQDWNDCNTFASPDRITPKEMAVKVDGAGISVDLPPLAVATVTGLLG